MSSVTSSSLGAAANMHIDTYLRPLTFRKVDIATGVLMHQQRCDPLRAHQALNEMASTVGRSVEEVADVVVHASTLGLRVEPHRV